MLEERFSNEQIVITQCALSISQNASPGMSSPLVSFAAIHAIAFGVYGNTMKLFADKNSLLASFIAGNAAGVAQCIVCTPSDMLKTKMQLQVYI